jgi:Terminase small subunit
MPALRNPVHESMVRDVAGGVSREAAWRAHGFGSRNSTRFFNRPKVAARLSELQSEFNEGSKIQLRYLEEKYFGIVNADIGQFVEKAPHSDRLRLRDVTRMAPEQRRAIQELVIEKNGRTSIKLESKSHALDALTKMAGGFAPALVVNATATAAASAQVEYRDLTAPEVARRISWVIEQAALEADDAELIDATPQAAAAGEPIDAAAAPPPVNDSIAAALSPLYRFAEEASDGEAATLAVRLRELAAAIESDLAEDDDD